jgi:hypothetical protein
MHAGSRPPFAIKISCAVAVCLALGGFFVTGCKRPASDSTASSPTTGGGAIANGTTVILSAEPNPVPGGPGDTKTTISWDTGSDAVGDVYIGTVGNEKLFASGPQGAEVASSIQPGSTEFRLYTHADHKLLAQLTVAMGSSDASAPNAKAAPVSSASP